VEGREAVEVVEAVEAVEVLGTSPRGDPETSPRGDPETNPRGDPVTCQALEMLCSLWNSWSRL